MKIRKQIVEAALLLAATILTIWGISLYTYPHGRRSGVMSLPGMHVSLMVYARDHEGWFPYSDKGSYAALQKLYPSYVGPDGRELAGISGNREAVTEALQNGIPLNESLTSWIYIQGLHENDPGNIALLWETKAGLYPNGKRNSFGGRAVLYLDGTMTNVPEANWEFFLKEQQRMREAVMAGRLGPGKE